ncbi:hypothetical protein BDF20DRAFT_820123 [Mycotypha africana]|uniref:uncharacterized protein n=1 Tax=Mycotypha africana TaxID=64632 RepID=UPI002300E732|nr:uncharacterized protein BDF20DRAFT_820123 [Mycotypha africana]KAI8979784.1 hypothetical protein BDF20DRAFT_820123 [Mycotypha africana]
MAQLENSLFLTDILSKVRFSYTDVGINLEAKVSNATDLTSLIEAFSQICCSSLANSTVTPNNARNEPTNRIVLSRNKSNQLKPVNFFKSACQLGIIANPHSSLETFSELKQIADACVDTFFLCKVRFKPIIQKDEFIRWYRMQENPLDTLIVNAMCSYVFRHMVIHHPRPAFKHFLQDLDKVQEQEEYFFSCARERLAQSFDTPDRYTVIALLFMSTRAEPSKRHHYAGMAVTAMHQLDIYPRMVHEEPDSYEKEMDTRLWWYLWAVDFSIWTAGSPKNSPQPKHPGEPDLPLVFEEDIDESEINVITFSHCLKLWRIQSNIVSALYDQQNSETMTVEQLYEFDKKLQHFYNQLPSYLVLDSGFEYGCEDLFLSCLRVNIEYNATRIILHKLFIPEMNDTAPNQSSLDSLNICLSTALTQLSAIKTCNMGDVGRCAFDRDELWRAAEVVSVAMDIYHNCLSLEAKQRILTNIKMDDFNRALQKSYEVLKNTREFRFSCKNWFQVADWIQAELQRHQSKYNSSIHDYHLPEEPTKVNKPDFFLAHLKPTATLNSRSNKPAVTKSANNKPRQKSITFQNHFSMHSSSFASSVKQQPTTSNNDTRRMSSSSTQLMEYNPDVLPSHTQQQKQFSNKTSARFRYFNPRKMNKFLFIDEHPML